MHVKNPDWKVRSSLVSALGMLPVQLATTGNYCIGDVEHQGDITQPNWARVVANLFNERVSASVRLAPQEIPCYA